MKNFDISHVQMWQKDLNNPILLSIFVRQKNSSDPFFRYGESLNTACKHIDIAFTKTESLPKIQIKDNLNVHSIPEGTEIQPFLQALTYRSNPPEKSAEYEGIETLPSSNLLLFVSPYCPNCPEVLKKILPIVWFNPDIDLTIIDVGLFPEEAEKRSILSVPTLMFKDFRWTGPVNVSEIMDVIQNPPDQWDAQSLERMLSEGKAVQLAQTILDQGKFVKNFDQLIAHELLSIRLGAMVCVEYIADENRNLAQNLSHTIWSCLTSSNIQVQGDLIYLIGICGTQKDIPKLKDMMAQADDNDIKESITEAIETIQEQS